MLLLASIPRCLPAALLPCPCHPHPLQASLEGDSPPMPLQGPAVLALLLGQEPRHPRLDGQVLCVRLPLGVLQAAAEGPGLRRGRRRLIVLPGRQVRVRGDLFVLLLVD